MSHPPNGRIRSSRAVLVTVVEISQVLLETMADFATTIMENSTMATPVVMVTSDDATVHSPMSVQGSASAEMSTVMSTASEDDLQAPLSCTCETTMTSAPVASLPVFKDATPTTPAICGVCGTTCVDGLCSCPAAATSVDGAASSSVADHVASTESQTTTCNQPMTLTEQVTAVVAAHVATDCLEEMTTPASTATGHDDQHSADIMAPVTDATSTSDVAGTTSSCSADAEAGKDGVVPIDAAASHCSSGDAGADATLCPTAETMDVTMATKPMASGDDSFCHVMTDAETTPTAATGDAIVKATE